MKFLWLPGLRAAAALDWNVEGGTYGIYAGLTAAPPAVVAPMLATCAAGTGTLGALGRAITVAANSDIDGDAVARGGRLLEAGPRCGWHRRRGARVAPAAPTLAGSSLVNCAGGLQAAANVGDGQIHTCSLGQRLLVARNSR